MECITCALCIDACDEVMDKLGRDRGLVDYLALSDAPREAAGEAPRPIWQHVLRPRTLLYSCIWAAFGLAMVYALFIRPEIEMTVAPVRNPTFVTLSDGSVRNTYELRLRNKHGEARMFGLHVKGDLALNLSLEHSAYSAVEVPADDTLKLRVHVTAAPSSRPALESETAMRFWVEDLANGERAFWDTVFNGRGGS
jgi:polyferredoxin